MKIPLDHHLKLRSLKLLRGKNMAETVQEALRLYFNRLERDDDWARVGAIADGRT